MNKIKTKEELRAMRKQLFEEMGEKLCAGKRSLGTGSVGLINIKSNNKI